MVILLTIVLTENPHSVSLETMTTAVTVYSPLVFLKFILPEAYSLNNGAGKDEDDQTVKANIYILNQKLIFL